MAQGKNKKYILTDLKLPEDIKKRLARYSERATRILWLDDAAIPGISLSLICSWYWKATEEVGTPAHMHDFDEVLGFFGSDSQNPHDLGGEVELWLEDEKYLINQSCLVFVPKGMKHCPLRVTRVERPIFFLSVSLSSQYRKIFDAKK